VPPARNARLAEVRVAGCRDLLRDDVHIRGIEPIMMSMIGLLASPGTAVLPMCSILATRLIRVRRRRRSRAKRPGHAAS
jgi:hypothetical protein